MALGADRTTIRTLVMWNGMRLALVGVVLGIAASFGLTRLIASFLFGVKSWDPTAFIAVPVVLWTITAFMRTYIAQPVIPAPKPLAAATEAPPTPVAAGAANNTAATAVNAPSTPPPATAVAAEARAMATEARGDLSARRDQIANPSGNPPASDAATAASVLGLTKVGTVAKGARAELIVSRADPRESTWSVQRDLIATVAQGALVTAEDLDKAIRKELARFENKFSEYASRLLAQLSMHQLARNFVS